VIPTRLPTQPFSLEMSSLYLFTGHEDNSKFMSHKTETIVRREAEGNSWCQGRQWTCYCHHSQ